MCTGWFVLADSLWTYWCKPCRKSHSRVFNSYSTGGLRVGKVFQRQHLFLLSQNWPSQVVMLTRGHYEFCVFLIGLENCSFWPLAPFWGSVLESTLWIWEPGSVWTTAFCGEALQTSAWLCRFVVWGSWGRWQTILAEMLKLLLSLKRLLRE